MEEVSKPPSILRFVWKREVMSIYIEAPRVYTGNLPSIFLAGGITGCVDWQKRAAELLKNSSFAILNPRRENFPIDDPNSAEVQIKWEFDHLYNATVILFWFSAESIQPIALYELGRWLAKDKPVVVGAHPNYLRRQDIEIQAPLVRPGIQIFDDLQEMIESIVDEKSTSDAALAYKEAKAKFYG